MNDICTLMPSDTPDYMLPAWLGCMRWALGSSEIVDSFRDQTGNNWTPGITSFERMIDKATGAYWQFLKAFVLWANEAIWGTMDEADE